MCISDRLYIVLVMMANTVIELLSSTLALPGILRGWGYVSSPAVVGASLLLQLILFSTLMVGAARWFYRLMGQEGSDVFDLFEFFSSFRQYFGSFWPVSYTHLDVYKRQSRSCRWIPSRG